MNDLKGIIEDCNKSDLISDKVIKKIIEIIGQEEWQELHDENNDVCTTMGELIITLKGITELEKENEELKEVHESDKRSLRLIAEKGANLEEKISVLLSCKNCSENKGGYICQKEYEDKCLAQKIQYIKELQEENAELQQKWLDESYEKAKLVGQLNKAKELLKDITSSYGSTEVSEEQMYLKIKRAEQFLKKENSIYERIQKAKYNYTD